MVIFNLMPEISWRSQFRLNELLASDRHGAAAELVNICVYLGAVREFGRGKRPLVFVALQLVQAGPMRGQLARAEDQSVNLIAALVQGDAGKANSRSPAFLPE